MCGMFFTCFFFFVQVSQVTMLTYNVSYNTPMLQRFDSSIDTRLQRKLGGHMLQIFTTQCCILIT